MNGGINNNVLKDTKGISLVEVLIVISIIAIIVAIPLLNSKSILNYRTKKELREFRNDICYTRNRTVVESQLYSIYIEPDKNMYIVCRQSIVPKIIKEKKFSESIKIIGTNIKNNEISFTYTGAVKNAGTIFLENKDYQDIEITIEPVTGMVNVYFNR